MTATQFPRLRYKEQETIEAFQDRQRHAYRCG